MYMDQTTSTTHGHHFFVDEVFFPHVYMGQKRALGEVMFLAALAWVEGEEKVFF